MPPMQPPPTPWRERMHEVTFEADTSGGRALDIALLLATGLSVLAVILESVSGIRVRHGVVLRACECPSPSCSPRSICCDS